MTTPPDPVPAHRRLGLTSGKQPPTRLPRRKPRKLPGGLQAGLRSMNPRPKHLLRLNHRVPGNGSRSFDQEGIPVLNIYVFITYCLVNHEPLFRVPQDINPIPSAKSVPVSDESPKVDKPPSPQAEKTTPEPLKPPESNWCTRPYWCMWYSDLPNSHGPRSRCCKQFTKAGVSRAP
jgi:hypothetical protein